MPERALRRLRATGQLVRILPGLYSAPEPSLAVRCRAVAEYDTHAVIVGRAAAALTWWPELSVPTICASRPHGVAASPGYTWTASAPPPHHVAMIAGIRFASPALTVLDLIPDLGGNAIDEALRRRATTLRHLWDALADTPQRKGNAARAALLHDSRDQPWSEAERALHRILRAARLDVPWHTNYRVSHGGHTAFLDAALPTLRRGLEVDGYEHHSSRAAFEADRDRDLWLQLAGWTISRFSARMVLDRPDAVAQAVRQLVARAR